ncbi:MAG: S1 RNA-binding domain-containing protein [Candidatus Heimdallarchaeota archaeon]
MVKENTQYNDFEDYDKFEARKKNLERIYSKKTGYKIKILSNEPYLEELLELYCTETNFSYSHPNVGDVIEGHVLGEDDKYVIVDGGFKDYVYIEKKGHELQSLVDLEITEKQTLEVMITFVDEDNFEIIGSVSAILQRRAYELLAEGLNEDRIFMGYVREFNPAGYFLELDVDGVSSEVFMPKTLAGINKLPNPESIVGHTFEVMIENKTKEGFIVSRKKFLRTLIKDKLVELEYSRQYTGNVTGTTDFGIFVEFNECLTGMIHKANIDHETTNLRTIEPGANISFFIKEIIKDKNRNDKIILTQILKETLWDTIKVADTLKGTVKNSKQFGALIQLDDGTVGLIHISELEKHGATDYDIGDEVEVKVISVQRAERKIFLTLDK